MRRPAFPIVLLLLLAGCAGRPEPSLPQEPTPPPMPARPYATFLCADGNLVRADAVLGNGSRCNVRITGFPPRPTGPANEFTIAVDPTNPLRLVAGGKDYALGPDPECGGHRVWAGHYWSHDGGLTWSNDLMPGHEQGPEAQVSNPLAGYRCTTDPVAYWTHNGTALFSGLSYNQGRLPDLGPESDLENNDLGGNVWLARSSDGGRTYADVFLVAQADGYTTFHDKQWFVHDPRHDAIYFTWSMFLWRPATSPRVPSDVAGVPSFTDQIVFTRSLDGGRTWSPLRILYETRGSMEPDPRLTKQFSMPQVDHEGNVHVIWLTYQGNGRGDVWHTRSTDRGDTWSPARVALRDVHLLPAALDGREAFRTNTLPVLAIDRRPAGALHLAYAARNGADRADVFLSSSRDGGETWSAPRRVNDDNTTRDQFMPWMEVGPRGDVHVVWLDRRDDAKNRHYVPYYAHVASNGSAIAPNVRLGDVPLDPAPSFHQNGREFLGDYIGVTEGSNGWVHPIWVDTREGRADAYTTILVRSTDEGL